MCCCVEITDCRGIFQCGSNKWIHNNREPMLPHDIPDGRWQKIAMDIMTYNGRDYLVIVDYYSKYADVSLLPDKTASSIIMYTKSICARHGIPEEIVSDNMPFDSREFKDFAYEWGIKTTASSPTYAQSNGQAERCVQTLKGLFKKVYVDYRDPYLALLEYRNTPVAGLQYTPSQMLMGRLLRSKLPTKQTLLQPNEVDAHRDLRCRQQRQKTYYDKSASPLQQLNRGDVVRVQRGNVCEPAVVTGPHIQPRSYLLQSQHGQLRRDRRHLYKTNEAPPLFASIDLTAAVRHATRIRRFSRTTERRAGSPARTSQHSRDAVGSRSFYQKWSYGQDSGKIPMGDFQSAVHLLITRWRYG